MVLYSLYFFFFQAEDGIRDYKVTGVQTCALPIWISRAAHDWVMLALSVLMLGSMHAVQINHLRHHRHCMEADDIEAMSAREPVWRAIAVGPLFPLRLHGKALAVATAR